MNTSELASAIRYAADRLGTGNAATSMGALEFVGKAIEDGFANLAGAIEAHAVDVEMGS